MKVIALIGDVVASREVTRRDMLQKELKAVLARLNRRGKKHGLLSPYTLTLGDEFQAVYGDAGRVWVDIFSVMTAVHPVKVRFSLGVGSLATPINSKQALGMDGPAFHRAREGLNSLKNDERLLRIVNEPSPDGELANHVLNFLSHQIERWNRNRLQILTGLLQGLEVREIGRDMSISDVAIYKNIRAAALDQMVRICQQLMVPLNEALAEK